MSDVASMQQRLSVFKYAIQFPFSFQKAQRFLVVQEETTGTGLNHLSVQMLQRTGKCPIEVLLHAAVVQFKLCLSHV